MKKIFVTFICILFGINFYAASASEYDKGPYMTRSFPVSSVKDIESTTSGGSISVSGDAATNAVVEVYASHSGWSDEKIKQTLEENYTIDIMVENGKLYATAKSKKNNLNWNSSVSVSFKISVSQQVNSKLQTSGGSISISGISGTQNFTTSGGSLNVENASGNITGATSGGSIRVSGSKDKIHLSTSGGSISADNCSGNLQLTTSGGSLKLNDLSGDINAATSGGSINASNINGTFKTGTSGGSVKLSNISGDLDAHTYGGSMTVEMASVNEYVKLSNSGNLELTLPGNKGYNLKVRANKIETSGLRGFRGDMETGKIEGTVDDGGPTVEVRSSQRVNLSFK